MEYKLVITNNGISSYLLFFLLIVGLYFLILRIIAQRFNHIMELIIPPEILIKEAKAETGIHTVTTNTTVRKCSL